MKKIALIGTHGIGKTTTAYGIAHQLKKMRYNAIVLNESARKCPLPINKKGTENSQLWIFGKQLCNESEIHPLVDFAICDRTVLDVLVYSSFNQHRSLTHALTNLVKHQMKTYDTIFYLPIRKDYLKSDGQRSGDVQYQYRIDVGFRHAIDYFSLPVVALKEGINVNVLQRIMYYLGNKYKLNNNKEK